MKAVSLGQEMNTKVYHTHTCGLRSLFCNYSSPAFVLFPFLFFLYRKHSKFLILITLEIFAFLMDLQPIYFLFFAFLAR